jgi:hypothetical protein
VFTDSCVRCRRARQLVLPSCLVVSFVRTSCHRVDHTRRRTATPPGLMCPSINYRVDAASWLVQVLAQHSRVQIAQIPPALLRYMLCCDATESQTSCRSAVHPGGASNSLSPRQPGHQTLQLLDHMLHSKPGCMTVCHDQKLRIRDG